MSSSFPFYTTITLPDHPCSRRLSLPCFTLESWQLEYVPMPEGCRLGLRLDCPDRPSYALVATHATRCNAHFILPSMGSSRPYSIQVGHSTVIYTYQSRSFHPPQHGQQPTLLHMTHSKSGEVNFNHFFQIQPRSDNFNNALTTSTHAVSPGGGRQGMRVLPNHLRRPFDALPR